MFHYNSLVWFIAIIVENADRFKKLKGQLFKDVFDPTGKELHQILQR